MFSHKIAAMALVTVTGFGPTTLSLRGETDCVTLGCALTTIFLLLQAPFSTCSQAICASGLTTLHCLHEFEQGECACVLSLCVRKPKSTDLCKADHTVEATPKSNYEWVVQPPAANKRFIRATVVSPCNNGNADAKDELFKFLGDGKNGACGNCTLWVFSHCSVCSDFTSSCN